MKQISIQIRCFYCRWSPAMLRSTVACLLAVAFAFDGYSQSEHNQPAYSHLILKKYVQSEGRAVNEVCYVALPGIEDAKTKRKLPRPTDPRASVLGVSSDAIFFSLAGSKIERVTIGDFEQRKFFSGPEDPVSFLEVSPSGNNFFAVPFASNTVHRFRVADETRELLVDRADLFPPILGGSRFADAKVSPTGEYVATATYTDYSEERMRPKFAVEIFVIDAEIGEKPMLSADFPGELLMTGAGSPVAAPAMLWKDHETLWLLAPSERDGEPSVQALDVAEDEWSHQLIELNVTTGRQNVVQNIRAATMRSTFSSCSLWQWPDGDILVEGLAGRFRIDLATGAIEKTRRLTKDYEFRGDNRHPSLWFKDYQLSAKVNPAFVSLSPDGQQIVWLSPFNERQKIAYDSTQFPQILRHHSAATGLSKLDAGEYVYRRCPHKYPAPVDNTLIYWIPN